MTFGKINNHLKTFKSELWALALLVVIAGCSKNNDPMNAGQGNMTTSLAAINQTVINLPTEPLDDAEKARILFIREEEKLVYNVIQTMFDNYGVNVFQNIPNSEFSHMEAMLLIIIKYNLVDPMETNAWGVYTTPVLQALYTQLVSQGWVSLLAAYQVGATIEELDISDLNSSLVLTNNQDVRLVYDFLNKGSRNHMRSFYRNIKNWNDTYTPSALHKRNLMG